MHERDEQTDRQTDTERPQNPRSRIASHGKNGCNYTALRHCVVGLLRYAHITGQKVIIRQFVMLQLAALNYVVEKKETTYRTVDTYFTARTHTMVRDRLV